VARALTKVPWPHPTVVEEVRGGARAEGKVEARYS